MSFLFGPALTVAEGGTNSSTTLNNGRIMISNGGKIVEAPELAIGQVLIGELRNLTIFGRTSAENHVQWHSRQSSKEQLKRRQLRRRVFRIVVRESNEGNLPIPRSLVILHAGSQGLSHCSIPTLH